MTDSYPGLVALYDIRPGNGADLFLQPCSPHGAFQVCTNFYNCVASHDIKTVINFEYGPT